MINSSDDMNPKLLEAKELIQVCIGLYQIILNFSDNVSISIESGVELNGATIECSSVDKNSGDLVGLLGATVVTASLDDGVLVLNFNNGCKLNVIKRDDGNESYGVNGSGGGFIV